MKEGYQMKKGVKLTMVVITKGKVTVYLNDGSIAKLSRNERNILSDYKNPNYVKDVENLFGNSHIFNEDFKVIKDGLLKFTYTE